MYTAWKIRGRPQEANDLKSSGDVASSGRVLCCRASACPAYASRVTLESPGLPAWSSVMPGACLSWHQKHVLLRFSVVQCSALSSSVASVGCTDRTRSTMDCDCVRASIAALEEDFGRRERATSEIISSSFTDCCETAERGRLKLSISDRHFTQCSNATRMSLRLRLRLRRFGQPCYSFRMFKQRHS